MITYIETDKSMALLIIEKFSRHQWYLSEEAIGMAFSVDISLELKRRMIKRLELSNTSSRPDVSYESADDSDDDQERDEDDNEPECYF